MKKVLFVVQKLADGGAERVVSVLANELVRRGLKVSVLIYFPKENEYVLDKYIEKIYLCNAEDEYRILNFGKKIKLIRKKLIEIGADYHVPFLYFVGIHVQLASIGLRAKVIQTVRNDPRSVPENKIVRWIRNLMFIFAWRGFVQNEKQIQYFPQFIRKKLHIIPNPVSGEFFEIKRNTSKLFKIIGVGRLAPQKNFALLIEAAKILYDEGENFLIEIYGDGPLKETLSKRINELRIADCCIMRGRCDNMREVYQNADIFVLSSNFEGMPNVLMEAMAAELPCVSTKCPTGPEELIDAGVNGILVEMDDKYALAEAIRELLLNPNRAREMGKMARKTIMESYSEKTIGDRFSNMLK